MKRSQANRAIIAARATRSTPNHGTIPLGSITVLPGGTGRVVKSHGTKLTATQKNSQGRPSEWNRSPEFFTDPKWSRTMRECE